MGLTNSFGGCIITVNMSPEVSRFRGNSGQAGSDVGHLAFGLIQKRAERDALIDRVVSFGATNRKVTVLETPVAFDSTVIDVTPRSPGVPSGDLSHDLVKNGSLSSEVRASSQPQPSEKKKKLGGLRDVAVKGTLFFTGAGLIVGACTPAQRAILEGAFPCAPGPIAGAADGNTAVIENPNLITISGNIFDDKREAIICLPTGQTVSVKPTPTPKSTPDAPKTPAPEVHTVQKEVIDAPFQEIQFKQLNSYIHRVYAPKAKGGLGKAPSDIFGPENEYHERTLEQMETILSWTQEKTSPDPNPKTRQKSRMETVNQITVFAYKVYKESGSIEWLRIAQKSFWYGETEFGKDDYQKVALPKLEGL